MKNKINTTNLDIKVIKFNFFLKKEHLNYEYNKKKYNTLDEIQFILDKYEDTFYEK